MSKILLPSEYGIFPCSTEETNYSFMNKCFSDMLKENLSDCAISFENGTYNFSAEYAASADYRLSNTDMIAARKLGILLKSMKNVTLDFGGAHLNFSGQMQPLTIDGCENITVKNFTADWIKPLVAEAVVRSHGTGFITVSVDKKVFPHEFHDGNLYFDVGAGETYPSNGYSMICYDPLTKTVSSESGDRFLADSVEMISDGLYRLNCGGSYIPEIGSILVMRHNARIHAGIFCENSKNITIENVTIHSCGGLGCLAQFSENLTYRNVNFVPNLAAGRLITSGRDDGMHITCNRGLVTIENCSFLGLMDDPINVHSCCAKAYELADSRTVRCKFMHIQAQGFLHWAKEGDLIAFIDRSHMNRFAECEIENYRLESSDTFTLTFKNPITDIIGERDVDSIAVDNLTNTCDFICRNNLFGSCRARGILISTPGKVVIENNIFESSGSAILVAGDSNGWYESGACRDVTIRGNVFTDHCLSSMYQFCDGIISICPVVPQPCAELPFHSNIKITDNVFYTPENPVLYSFSAENVEFSENRIVRSYRSKPWHPRKYLYNIEYCKNVKICSNTITGNFELGDIISENSVTVSYEK